MLPTQSDICIYIYIYIYGTAQMQLHSRARVTSGALEGLLKVTRHKLCESSRFSTLSSLVSITHPGIRLLASYDFYRALQ